MKKFRIVGLLLVLCLISSSFVGVTFAKYTSTARSSDNAFVAKWSVEVEDEQIAVVPAATYTFDLFATTVNDTDGTSESDVKTGSSLIAPGTSGSFELNIENLSEVNAKYTITFVETNAQDIPLQYSTDGTAWYDSISELENSLKGSLAMETGAIGHTIHWRWAFNDTDIAVADGNSATDDAHAGQKNETDTLLGIYAQNTGAVPSVTIEATVTVSQVD